MKITEGRTIVSPSGRTGSSYRQHFASSRFLCKVRNYEKRFKSGIRNYECIRRITKHCIFYHTIYMRAAQTRSYMSLRGTFIVLCFSVTYIIQFQSNKDLKVTKVSL